MGNMETYALDPFFYAGCFGAEVVGKGAECNCSWWDFEPCWASGGP